MIEACYESNVFNLTQSHVWLPHSSWSHYSNILVVNIQIFQVVKNSNISGCQKLKYFWLSKIRIFLVVKIEKTIYIFQVSFYLRPLSVKPLRQESVPYFLSSCSEAWTDHGEVLFCTEFYDLPFNILISCHPEEELVSVFFKIIGGSSCPINETTSRRLPPLRSSKGPQKARLAKCFWTLSSVIVLIYISQMNSHKNCPSNMLIR